MKSPGLRNLMVMQHDHLRFLLDLRRAADCRTFGRSDLGYQEHQVSSVGITYLGDYLERMHRQAAAPSVGGGNNQKRLCAFCHDHKATKGGTYRFKPSWCCKDCDERLQ